MTGEATGDVAEVAVGVGEIAGAGVFVGFSSVEEDLGVAAAEVDVGDLSSSPQAAKAKADISKRKMTRVGSRRYMPRFYRLSGAEQYSPKASFVWTLVHES